MNIKNCFEVLNQKNYRVKEVIKGEFGGKCCKLKKRKKQTVKIAEKRTQSQKENLK